MTRAAAFSSWSTTRSSTACGRRSWMFKLAGVVYGEGDRAACLEYIEQNWPDIRPKACARGWQAGQGVSIGKPDGFDDHALPLTRGQLDIRLAQETGHPGTEWQLSVFARIEGTVKPDLFEQAIRQVMREAEPAQGRHFRGGWPGFPTGIDPDFELEFYDLNDSDHAVQEAHEIASSI